MSGPPSAISTTSAPAPVGPYSQAVASDGLLFVSGQLGIDVRTGEVVEGGAAAQAEQALRNVAAIISAAGATPGDIVKVSVYLRDIGDFPAVNEVYARFFTSWKPARTTIGGLQLPKAALVEVDAVARLP